MLWLLTLCVCAFVSPGPGPAQEPEPEAAPPRLEVTFEKHENGIVVSVGDDFFTQLREEEDTPPYFWPLLGPEQVRVTRDFPMARSEGDSRDHPHHRSLWFAHGNVNGHDFWHGKGLRIVPTRPSVPRTEGPATIIDSHYSWQAGDGTKVLEEHRTVRFSATERARAIDFRFRLRAAHGEVRFGDTKEGTFAIRLHPALRLKGKVATGTIVNSTGDRDGKVWGQPAKWVMYSGTVDDAPLSVAILDHPLNLRHPTTWHARDYGLLAANPFGRHHFQGLPRGSGEFVLSAGETLELRYQVVIVRGQVTRDAFHARWLDWAKADRIAVDLSGEKALDAFFRVPAAAWKISPTEGGNALELVDGGSYQPPHRSPGRIALWSGQAIGDFTLELDALQTGREYGHRDLCVFFGFQDPARYYYVHLATTPDERACNVFLVDQAARRRIASIPKSGVEWGTNRWHRLRIERRLEDGMIRVYFDDLETPVLFTRDRTHGIGHIGVGSFDDTGQFRRLHIWSADAHPPRLEKSPFPTGG